MSRRARWTALGLLAFAVRAAFVLHDSRGPGELLADAEQYYYYAVNLAAHGRYVDDFGDRLFRMPGYSIFMAGIFSTFGRSILAVQLMQCALSALAVVGLGIAAESLCGGWGIFCGLGACFYFGSIEPCARILSESLDTTLIAAFLWAWYRPSKTAPASSSAFLALILSLACMVRPDIGLFAAVACVLLPWLDRRYRWRHAFLWIPIALAVFTPWFVRNALLFHRFIPGSTQAEAGLYMGLALPLEHLGDIPTLTPTPAGLSELEQKAYYAGKFKAVWHAAPYARIATSYVFDGLCVFYPFLPAYDWTYMLFVPFWLWACWLAGRDERLRVMVLLVALYWFVHLFVGGPESRYRQPLTGPLLVLAAVGARDLHRRWGAKFWKGSASYALANVLVWAFAPRMRELVLTIRTLFLKTA